MPLRPTFLTVALTLGLAVPASADSPSFEVTYTAGVHPGPVSARVYLILGPPNATADPRHGPDWFHPAPFFAVEARDWKPGEPLKVDATAAGFPTKLDALKPGDYRAQAVIRMNRDAHALDAQGNGFSKSLPITIAPDNGGITRLVVDKVEGPPAFETNDRIKLVTLPSPLLSAFYGRPMVQRAAVILPEGDRSVRRPTLYIVPGFGGDYTMARAVSRQPRMAFAADLIRVVLDPDCGTGHHVFADSATNGPRGEALIKEFIPHIEKTFNAIPEPGARLLNGHSSGGWSTLWLQVRYPDVFGGTWSTSPDPVDFRDFQRIDLYAKDVNFYREADGSPRPVARIGGKPAQFVEPFCRLEDVLGDGGQMGSFEAVFSPLDRDGHPRKLWDRATGIVDPETARTWEKYDIRLVLERNWSTLGPKLKGKIHLTMGDADTFYLEGATILLKAALEKLGSDARITIVPGKNHSSVLTTDLAAQLDREMHEAVSRYLPGPAKAGANP